MIPEQKVKVKWNRANKKSYQEKYTFTKFGDEFEVNISDLTIGSHSLVKFICDYCNGDNQTEENQRWKVYKALIKQKKFVDKDCCESINCRYKKAIEVKRSKNSLKELTLADEYPNLGKEYSSKNKLKLSNYTQGSSEKVWWVCNKGHEWKTSISGRVRGNGCPYCTGVFVSEINSLSINYPDLANQWHPNKNKNLTPDNISYGSSDRKVWWLGDCGHEWEDTVHHRVSGRKCPYCSNKRVNFENCLATVRPDLLQQWESEKNGNMTPYNIVSGSHKKAWWKCSKDHYWQATIVSRSRNDNGCPYCAGRKVCSDNCLATLRPDLVTEWNYNKNKKSTPYNVTKNSNKKVWWVCSKCSNEWESTVTNRSNGNGCPQCKESKGEREVRKILEEYKVRFSPQYEFNNLVGVGNKFLKFDFAVFKDKKLILLIEYDGDFHFEKKYDGDGHELILIHDQRKNEYCKKNNIPLLRIPYWEFNNIEEILTKELQKYNIITPF